MMNFLISMATSLNLFLFLGMISHTYAKCDTDSETPSFIMSTHIRPSVVPYRILQGVPLVECSRQCLLQSRCRSVTFVRTRNEMSCHLAASAADNKEMKNLGRTSSLETSEKGIYYFEKICVKGTCDHLFVAESIQGMELQGHDDLIIENATRYSCLERCLESRDMVCRSLEHDAKAALCRLSSHDRFDRKSSFRKSSASVEYMDVSCSNQPYNEKTPSAEISLMGNVEHQYSLLEFYGVSAGECGDMCLRNTLFPCRSFLSGRINGTLYCGLAHQDRESFLQKPGALHSSRSLNYYEVSKTVEACEPDDLHFELVSGMVLNVNPYMVTSDLTPKQCLDLCKRDRRCKSLGIDYRKGACQYNSEAVGNSMENKMQKNGNFNYFEKVCLPGGAGSQCSRDWAFERTSKKELVGIEHEKVLVSAKNKEECQASCLNYAEFLCRSAEFDQENNECRLSPYNRFSSTEKGVALTHSKSPIDYFENNCITETRGFCNTRLIKRLRLLLPEKVVSGDSMSECQEACYNNEGFICRSITFDARYRTCGLSHHTRKSAPQESIARVDSSEFLEISTCFSVSVECKPDLMLAKVQTNALFKGKVYAKGRPVSCSTDVSNSLEFTLPIPLTGPDCGTITEEEGKFSNVLVIQSNDHVVTALDKAVGVHCSYDVGNKTEETEINITDPNSSDKTRGSPALPDLSLHIVDIKGKEKETVSLGELLRVQVRMSDEDTYGIFVRNLVAKDGTGGNNLTLIDNTGCPVEVKMMREVRTIEPQSKSLEGYLEAFTFTGSSILELEAEVETCLDSCKPVLCQIPTGRKDDDIETVSSFGRKKRESGQDKSSTVLASTKLTKSLSIETGDFEMSSNFLPEDTFAFPVTAPSPTSDRGDKFSAFGQPGSDPTFCFEPTMFTIIVGFFFCAELCGFSACLIGACRWNRKRKLSNKKRHLSIYYENSISDGSDLTTN